MIEIITLRTRALLRSFAYCDRLILASRRRNEYARNIFLSASTVGRITGTGLYFLRTIRLGTESLCFKFARFWTELGIEDFMLGPSVHKRMASYISYSSSFLIHFSHLLMGTLPALAAVTGSLGNNC